MYIRLLLSQYRTCNSLYGWDWFENNCPLLSVYALVVRLHVLVNTLPQNYILSQCLAFALISVIVTFRVVRVLGILPSKKWLHVIVN